MARIYRETYLQWGHDFRLSANERVRWLEYGSRGLLEKYLKWKTAHILALAWRSEAPPLPTSLRSGLSGMVTCGLLGTDRAFLRNRCRSQRTSCEALRLFFSLYQAKAAAHPVPASFVSEAVAGCIHRLTTEDDIPDIIDVEGTPVSKDDMADQVIRTVREIYGSVRAERTEPPGKGRAGSCRSSVEYTRAMGGPHQCLSDRLGLRGASYLLGIVSRAGRTNEIRLPGHPEDWEDVLEDSRRRAWTQDLIACYPVALTEPFKVRVITRGAVDPYHLSRRYQPDLWRPLARFPSSRLVGEPTSKGAILQFLSECDPDDDRLFVSGDYEAATDYLDPDLSRTALEAACDSIGVPAEDKIVLLRALTAHVILDPESGEEVGRQVRGQLMGSPISFPVLCILNLAFTRYALELAGKTVLRLDDLPILVNGDDLLFRAHPWEYRVWERITRFGGLRPSLGKNYVASNTFTVNSELWRARICHHEVAGQVTPFYSGERLRTIQWGQLYGSVKGHAKTGTSGEAPLFSPGAGTAISSRGQCWREFLDSCNDRARAYSLLWEVHSTWLSCVVPPGMSYSLPISHGGAGFPAPPSTTPEWVKRRASGYQLAKARYFLDHWSEPRVRRFLRCAWGGDETPAYLYAYESRLSQVRRFLRLRATEVTEGNVDDLALEHMDSPIPLSGFYGLGVRDERTDQGRITEAERVRTCRRLWRDIDDRVRTSRCVPLHPAEIGTRTPKVAFRRWSL
nr:MAG: putative RNA-dependent RNA polymerase [Narnaviridae sp.]